MCATSARPREGHPATAKARLRASVTRYASWGPRCGDPDREIASRRPWVPAFAGMSEEARRLATSKLRPVRALQAEHRARVLRRRHLEAELLDQAPRLAHLLGVAFGQLAAADEQAVFEAHAHVAAHHHRLGGERHLETPGAEHRPRIVVAEQLVGGALHEEKVLHVGADAAENAEDQLQEDRGLEPAFVDAVGEIVEMTDVVALVLELGAVPLAHQLRDLFDV